MMFELAGLLTGLAIAGYIVVIIILLMSREKLAKDSFWTTIGIFVTILLLVYIGKKNFFPAVGLLIATITFVIVFGMFKASQLDVRDVKIKALRMDQKTLENAKSALTGGAAMLSVISCYTTANGMRDVVFGGWLAYPASIAVQVTLAFLSFFLLRFILAVQDLNWPKVAEKIVSYALVLVTAGYLMISSLFSYSFIATKAYEKTRDENNEAIARTYFTETANLLESENTRRGAALYSELSNAINDSDGISLAIQTQRAVENEQLNSQLLLLMSGISRITVDVSIEREVDFSDIKVSENDSDIRSAINTLLRANDNMRKLATNLDSALSELNAITQKSTQTLSTEDYNAIMSDYNILYGSENASVEETLNQTGSSISGIRGANNRLRNHIIRTQNSLGELKNKYGQLKGFLEKAIAFIDQNNMMQLKVTQNSSSVISIQNPEDILKRINEIQIKAEVSSTQDAAKNDLDNLLEEVNAWTVSQNLTSQTVEKIRKFCENLKEYRKYIELKQTLEQLNEDAIKKVYIVVSSEEEEKTVGDILYTTEAKWMAARNETFYMLENSIALLPDDLNIETDESENTSKISVIPSEAIRMQRTLFAELTDVERAINYFGNEYVGYRKMAVFSVVMAVFFDLGAFISGNLVMLIQYFSKDSPEDEDSDYDN